MSVCPQYGCWLLSTPGVEEDKCSDKSVLDDDKFEEGNIPDEESWQLTGQ